MRIGKIDIDKNILKAQADGKLVIFAGAGVSIPSPSNYPNFEGLADEIAAGILAREKDEPIERFLGRLGKRDVKIHRLIKERLSQENSQPNPLHNHLLTIASSNSGFRLITTNFDTHFSTAAEQIFKLEPESYFAPALPLGDKFDGIVYLHGSVKKDENSLVLTDRDFAQAYLTEGWATRFLLSLFQKYTILFVGYSHDDTVMQYLARGISEDYGQGRYALTPARENKNDHWSFLGITPMPYPQEHDHDHSALHDTLEEWSRRTKLGAMGHEQWIMKILSGNPPLIPEEDDYLEASLADPSKVSYFVRHATSPAWLNWAEEKKVLDPLFQPYVQLDECQRKLADWMAGKFVCEYSEDFLALFMRKGQLINSELWSFLAWRIAYGKPSLCNKVLIRWIHWLLQFSCPPGQHHVLCDLLLKCKQQDCCDTALLLLERLTQPVFRLRQAFSFPHCENDKKRQVNWNLSIPISYHYFTKAWEQVFQPQLYVLAERIASITIHRLQQAHQMFTSVADESDALYKLCFSRAAIEPHEQDRYPEDIDILINLARNALEWIAKNKSEQSKMLIDSLIHSNVPILRRLGVHCVNESSFLTPDEKVEWLLCNVLLYASHERHEVYHLLKEYYSLVSEKLRIRLLGIANSRPEYVDKDDHKRHSFNLVEWLHQAAPACQHTSALYGQLQNENPDFLPSDHPDIRNYFSVTSGASDDPRISNVRSILQKDPKQDIDWFVSSCGDGIINENRDQNFVCLVAEAVAQDRDWGWRLLQSLKDNSAWKSELWDGVFSGLAKSAKANKDWRDVISFLEDNAGLLENAVSGLRFLKDTIINEELPLSLVARVEKIFPLLWKKASDAAVCTTNDTDGWFFSIKDHVGGIAVQFWVFALRHHLKWHKVNKGIARKYKRVFESLLLCNSPSDATVRAMLAHYIQFFYSLDESWTQHYVMPLLDWNIDECGAERAWHCYLNNSRVDMNAFEASLGYYRQTFSRVGTRLGLFRESFVQHIALYAVESSANPLVDNWLGEFLSSVEPDDREKWAWGVWRHLESLNPEAINDLWDRWLNTYWKQRIHGIPLPLEQEELEFMMHWLEYLCPVFPAVVKYICKGPAPNELMFHELARLDWIAKYPESLSELLCFFLRHATSLSYQCNDALKLVRMIHDAGNHTSKLDYICNRLCELGCPAEKLQDFLH